MAYCSAKGIDIMQEVIEFIKVVGFPAFVCAWFMLRHDRRIDKMNESLEHILITLEKHKKD